MSSSEGCGHVFSYYSRKYLKSTNEFDFLEKKSQIKNGMQTIENKYGETFCRQIS